MNAGRGNHEAKRGKPGSCHVEILCRQHEMIERMSAGGCCSGHAGAMCIIPQTGSSLNQAPATTSAE
jgi:hypothetical protein